MRGLLGNRRMQQAATAPAAANIKDAFTGAQMATDRSMVRGGVRDQALATLSRDSANQTSRLYAGVQPGAANALMSGGQGMVGAGTGATGAAGTLALGGGNLALGQAQQQYGFGQGYGNLLFNLFQGLIKPQGGSGGVLPSKPAWPGQNPPGLAPILPNLAS